MAGGWSRDGAVQDQIDASVNEALSRVRQQIPAGESLEQCEECDSEIPIARRQAVKGVRYCIACQERIDQAAKETQGYNRRGSKDSQLR